MWVRTRLLSRAPVHRLSQKHQARLPQLPPRRRLPPVVCVCVGVCVLVCERERERERARERKRERERDRESVRDRPDTRSTQSVWGVPRWQTPHMLLRQGRLLRLRG